MPPGDAAVHSIAYAASMLVHGPLSDRFGRRPVLLAGMTLYSLASFGCALAPSIEVVLAWRIVQAFGAAAGVVLARAIVRDAMEDEAQTRTNAYLSTSQGISPALAPFLGGLLVEWGGWTWTFHSTVVPSGAPAFTAIVTAMLVYTFGQGFLFPTATTCAIRPFPEKAGTASSRLWGPLHGDRSPGSFAPALVSPDVMVGLPVVMAIGMALSAASLALAVLPAMRAA